MLNELRFGDEVEIWPALGLRVVQGPGGPDLPADGATVAWSEWWYARHQEGAIHLHDPRPQPSGAADLIGTFGETEGTPQPGEQLGPPGIEPARYVEPTDEPAPPLLPSTSTTRS